MSKFNKSRNDDCRSEYSDKSERSERSERSEISKRSWKSERSNRTDRSTSSKLESKKDPNLKKALEKLMDERVILKNSIKSQNMKFKSIQEELDTSEAYYKGQITTLLNERDTLATQVDKFKKQLELSKKSKNTLSPEEVSKLKSQNEAAVKEIQRLSLSIQEQASNYANEKDQICKSYTSQIDEHFKTIHNLSNNGLSENNRLSSVKYQLQESISEKFKADVNLLNLKKEYNEKLGELQREKIKSDNLLNKTRKELEALSLTIKNERITLDVNNKLKITTLEKYNATQISSLKSSYAKIITSIQGELTKAKADLETIVDNRLRDKDSEINKLKIFLDQRNKVHEKLRTDHELLNLQHAEQLKQKSVSDTGSADKDIKIRELENKLLHVQADNFLKLKKVTHERDIHIQEELNLGDKLKSKDVDIERLKLEIVHIKSQNLLTFKTELTNRVDAEKIVIERNIKQSYDDKYLEREVEFNNAKTKVRELEHLLDIRKKENQVKLTGLVQQHRFDIQILNTQLNSVRSELNNKNAEYVDYSNKLKKMLVDATRELNKLQADSKVKDENIASMTLQLEDQHQALAKSRESPDQAMKIRKIRSDCLETLKKERADNQQLKSQFETLQVSLENIKRKLADKEIECNQLIAIHNEIKSSFTDNLNGQKQIYNEALLEKDEVLLKNYKRISELEQLLSSAMIKMIDK